MRDACQVDFENNNAVGPQDESGPCAKAMARTPLHGLVVGAFLEFSPNVLYSLCKELVDIGLKNPNARISKYSTPMEVDLMRGLALQSMHRKIAVVCFRGQVLGGLVPQAHALTTLLQPHLAVVAVQAVTRRAMATSSWTTRWPATSAGFTRESK